MFRHLRETVDLGAAFVGTSPQKQQQQQQDKQKVTMNFGVPFGFLFSIHPTNRVATQDRHTHLGSLIGVLFRLVWLKLHGTDFSAVLTQLACFLKPCPKSEVSKKQLLRAAGRKYRSWVLYPPWTPMLHLTYFWAP